MNSPQTIDQLNQPTYTESMTNQRQSTQVEKHTSNKALARSMRFWDRLANRYSKKPVPDEAVYQKKLEITRGYLHQDMNVLEVGCGTGSTALAHAPYVKHIHATDVSAKMIQIATDKAIKNQIDNVTFEQLPVEASHQPDRSLDAVLALSVLHLLDDKESVINRIYTMLKPGGVFVSSTACLGDSMKFFKYIAPVGQRLGLLPILTVFTQDNFLKCLTDAGFVVDFQWQPGKGQAVFVVAKKPEPAA